MRSKVTKYKTKRNFDVLQNFYNAGLYNSPEVFILLKRITQLDTEQIKEWFKEARKYDEPVDSYQRPLNQLVQGPNVGEWNPTNRKILKAFFGLGFGVAKWYGLIVAITGLHKSQVSNWVRQQRYRLRKVGQFPAVPKTVSARPWSHKFHNKEVDSFFSASALPPSRKRRRPRGLSPQPKAKRSFPSATIRKERLQPGTFPPVDRNAIFTKFVKSPSKSVEVYMAASHAEDWGMQFSFDATISKFVVTRVDLGLQAHEKGVMIGWTLKRVNGVDATPENRNLIELFFAQRMRCYISFSCSSGIFHNRGI